MYQNKYPMTEKGLEKLKQELQKLETVQRPQAKQRINHARNFCNFQEEAEYELSLKHLAKIDDRIADLQYMIQQAAIIHPKKTSRVEIGSTVHFQDVSTLEQETCMIVGKEEADPTEGKIFHDSPVGKSLLGAEVNDEVTIEAPGGNRHVKIIKIS